jgi:hypothetical protein
MGTIRKNRSFRKKGGSGKGLPLKIKDENLQNLHVPVEKDKDGEYQYMEDIGPAGTFAQVRSDGKPPQYDPKWRKFDETAIKFYENNPKKGGKRKKTKRKYRKGKKTRKVKKSRKRARK